MLGDRSKMRRATAESIAAWITMQQMATQVRQRRQARARARARGGGCNAGGCNAGGGGGEDVAITDRVHAGMRRGVDWRWTSDPIYVVTVLLPTTREREGGGWTSDPIYVGTVLLPTTREGEIEGGEREHVRACVVGALLRRYPAPDHLPHPPPPTTLSVPTPMPCSIYCALALFPAPRILVTVRPLTPSIACIPITTPHPPPPTTLSPSLDRRPPPSHRINGAA